jgi:hypothetical protein
MVRLAELWRSPAGPAITAAPANSVDLVRADPPFETMGPLHAPDP